MHYYPHNIPDFNNATRHLTRVERSVYRDAIERYYDTESPLPADDFNKLSRILLCSSEEEKQALKLVLDEFFDLVDGFYHHARCNHEIEKYRLNSTAKAKAGKASAEARRNKRIASVEHTLKSVEQNNNQEPITNNQETVNSKQDKPAAKPLITFSSWIKKLKDAGEDPISADDPIFDYALDAGIDMQFLRLAWEEFRDRYLAEDKRYKDWRSVYRKAIRENWLKLWWHDVDGYKLTSKGLQAMTAMNNRDKREGTE